MESANECGRVSMDRPAGALPFASLGYEYKINEEVLGRINGRWRKVRIVAFETDTIEGIKHPVVVGAWQVKGTEILMKKRFCYMVDDDLLPDTKHTSLWIASHNQTID